MFSEFKYRIFRLREYIRSLPVVSTGIYSAQNLRASIRGRLVTVAAPAGLSPLGVAMCLRMRDESLYLQEWISYYLAAGVSHFYIYNNFSTDGYAAVLRPYVEDGSVTLIDWPRSPASPDAEEDCIRRAIGRFEWVGFLDADEFVVISSGKSIPDYLAAFHDAPGVALHWFYFGSNGHRVRPTGTVIESYRRRQIKPNRHVKCFVRPECVTQNRNSHSWFYRGRRSAVNECGQTVRGSINVPSAYHAWINHYYCKSLQDYMEKAKRRSTLDISGVVHPSRLVELAEQAISESNDIEDRCAIEYFRHRLHTIND